LSKSGWVKVGQGSGWKGFRLRGSNYGERDGATDESYEKKNIQKLAAKEHKERKARSFFLCDLRVLLRQNHAVNRFRFFPRISAFFRIFPHNSDRSGNWAFQAWRYPSNRVAASRIGGTGLRPVPFGLLVRQSCTGGGGRPNCRIRGAPGGTPAATGRRPVPPPKKSKWLQVNPSGSKWINPF